MKTCMGSPLKTTVREITAVGIDNGSEYKCKFVFGKTLGHVDLRLVKPCIWSKKAPAATGRLSSRGNVVTSSFLALAVFYSS